MNAHQRVMDVLARGPASQADLEALTGCSRPAVVTTLYHLRAAGRLETRTGSPSTREDGRGRPRAIYLLREEGT